MKIKALVPALMLGATFASQDAAALTYYCAVTEVATLANRVHVGCGPSPTFYYALPTSSSSEAQRLVTLGTAALVGGRLLAITYDWWDHKAASYGCAVNDCRRPIEITLVK